MMKTLLVALLVPGFLIGCALLGADSGPGELSPEELRAAPETVTIDGRTLALRTYMWRDFMPISPPDGKPLIAIFWVYSVDSTALPVGLTANAGWVVHKESVWDTFFEEPGTGQQVPYELERVAREGPKWGPHVEVDAVVRIRESDGTTHLLRAEKQSIERTD
jgi:hypothetical protein